MIFYTGLHQPSDAGLFHRAFISVNRVRGRTKPVAADHWILDSGAFQELALFGRYREDESAYAAECIRLATCNPTLRAVVSQDYMCEAHILEKTGLSIADHQRLTIERYDVLRQLLLPAADRGVYLMPVLQGYSLDSYIDHVRAYGSRLGPGAYVGVGSICKRNSDMRQIEAQLIAIKRERPDLRLHGFGLKITALGSGVVRELLYSADSMAWSWSARRQGRDGNSWREAQGFEEQIASMPVQLGWRF